MNPSDSIHVAENNGQHFFQTVFLQLTAVDRMKMQSLITQRTQTYLPNHFLIMVTRFSTWKRQHTPSPHRYPSKLDARITIIFTQSIPHAFLFVCINVTSQNESQSGQFGTEALRQQEWKSKETG